MDLRIKWIDYKYYCLRVYKDSVVKISYELIYKYCLFLISLVIQLIFDNLVCFLCLSDVNALEVLGIIFADFQEFAVAHCPLFQFLDAICYLYHADCLNPTYVFYVFYLTRLIHLLILF